MKCKQATKLISQSQDRLLTFRERLGLIVHLATCKQCRNFQKNCTNLRALMHEFKTGKND